MTIDNVKEELVSILTEIEMTGGSMVTSIYKDELKMAIDIIDKYQKFQDQSLSLYMERLKADMVAMLTDIQLEIKELWDNRYDVWLDNQYYIGKSDTLEEVDEVIQHKIDKLKEAD